MRSVSQRQAGKMLRGRQRRREYEPLRCDALGLRRTPYARKLQIDDAANLLLAERTKQRRCCAAGWDFVKIHPAMEKRLK